MSASTPAVVETFTQERSAGRAVFVPKRTLNVKGINRSLNHTQSFLCKFDHPYLSTGELFGCSKLASVVRRSFLLEGLCQC